ncbi:MAG: LPP20 family lipoprotein [Elusimicrobiota bacterium]
MKKFLLVSGIMFCFSANVFSAKAPDWLNGSSKQFPDKDYIIGVGIAQNLDNARSNARAEIAKIFRVTISQVSESSQSETTSVKERAVKSFGEAKSESKTRVSTDEVIQGIKIAQTYFDKKKKTYYALATLDKKKARAMLSDQIAGQEAIINNGLMGAMQSESAVEKVRFLTAANDAFDKEEELVSKRKIVDPISVPEISALPREALRAKLDVAKSKVIFIVNSSDNDNLKSAISERITRLGFKIAPVDSANKYADNTIIYVKCALSVEPAERNNPTWKFYNWSGTYSISEGSESGKVVAAAEKRGQVSQLNEEASKDKGIVLGGQELALAVGQAIRQYMFGK